MGRGVGGQDLVSAAFCSQGKSDGMLGASHL